MSLHKSSFGGPTDLASLKDIPGYKAILKTVLKSQIQLLIEQLAENTGEESIILTASVNDGSLSHLGSNMGKTFLDGREEIKSQFLGFCLKGHHQIMQDEDRSHVIGRSNPPHISQMSARRPRIRAHPYAVSPPHSHASPSTSRSTTQDFNNTNPSFIKPENGSSNSADSFLESVTSNNNLQEYDLSHTQTSSQNEETDFSADEKGQLPSNVQVKLEPGSEEVEETGCSIVESGDNSTASDHWVQRDPNEADQSGFSDKDDITDPSENAPENLGGVIFPGMDNSAHDFRNLPEISQTELKHVLYPDNNPLLDMQLQAGLFPIYSSSMRSRMSSPRKGPQYWCKSCNKPLQNKALYEYHLRAHNGVKPYECKLCFRKFAGKQVLETHMRLHSGEKPFKCNVPGCDRAFSARSGYDYHIKKHHPPEVMLGLGNSPQ